MDIDTPISPNWSHDKNSRAQSAGGRLMGGCVMVELLTVKSNHFLRRSGGWWLGDGHGMVGRAGQGLGGRGRCEAV